MDKKIGLIILVLLALTPIFNFREVLSFMTVDRVRGGEYFNTPVYIKLIKDAGFTAIILLSILNMILTGKFKRRAFFLAMMAGVFAALSALSYSKSPLYAFAGLRWSLPILLIPCLIGVVDDRLMSKIAKTIATIFLLSFAVQIGQYAYHLSHKNDFKLSHLKISYKYLCKLQIPPKVYLSYPEKYYLRTNICNPAEGVYQDYTDMDITQVEDPLAQRKRNIFYNPLPPEYYVNITKPDMLNYLIYGPRMLGIFIMHNTAALFACITILFAYFYLKKSILRTATLVIVPLAILIYGSGIGDIAFIILAGYLFLSKKVPKKTLGVILIITITLSISLLPMLTGRQDIANSPKSRLTYFIKILNNAEPISTKFGIATNSVMLLSSDFKIKQLGILSESTIASVLANIGGIGLGLLIAAYMFWIFFVSRSGKQDAVALTIIYTLFSCTTIITEAFPANLLFAVGIAYFAPKILTKPKVLHG